MKPSIGVIIGIVVAVVLVAAFVLLNSLVLSWG